jgi:hypothetical protein
VDIRISTQEVDYEASCLVATSELCYAPMSSRKQMTPQTMCVGFDCLIKDKCWRYRAQRDPYLQDYYPSPPEGIHQEKGSCFWKARSKDLTENKEEEKVHTEFNFKDLW